MPNIKTKTARDRLSTRPNAYYEVLSKGRALGFRRGPDTWFARLYKPNSGRKHPFEYQPLGQHEDFTSAKKAAEDWFGTATRGARKKSKRGTVRDALDAYIADLRTNGRMQTAIEAEARFKLLFDDDAIAGLRLDLATREDFEDWRKRKREGRLPRSLNRHVRSVSAALTQATEELGHVGNSAAWNMSPLADDKEESSEAATFLTPEQRKRLIELVPKELANYLRGLECTGARPSELAIATVSDFYAKQGSITLKHRKGRPPKLKTRAVILGSSDVPFFKELVQDKCPTDPLVPNTIGGHWRRHEWSMGIREAIKAANKEQADRRRKPSAPSIPRGACAYSFRHARISELLQDYGVDPLTVAAQTGTSLAMIEKYYYKFFSNELRNKLDAVMA
jgi:integrase